jgi:hypothetical protein
MSDFERAERQRVHLQLVAAPHGANEVVPVPAEIRAPHHDDVYDALEISEQTRI